MAEAAVATIGDATGTATATATTDEGAVKDVTAAATEDANRRMTAAQF